MYFTCGFISLKGSINSNEFIHLRDFLVPEHLDDEAGTRPLKTISCLVEEYNQIKRM